MSDTYVEKLIADKRAYREQCLHDLQTLYMGYTTKDQMRRKLREAERINAEIQRIDNEIAILRRSSAWFDMDSDTRKEKIRRMTTERISKQQALETKTTAYTRDLNRQIEKLRRGVIDTKLMQKVQAQQAEVRRLSLQVKELDDEMRGLVLLVATGLFDNQQLGTYAILYNEEHYGGDGWVILDNLPDIDNIIGRCHSIKVGNKTCVTLHAQPAYQGSSQPVYSDIPQLDTNLHVDQLLQGVRLPSPQTFPFPMGNSRTRLGATPRSFRLEDASEIVYEGGWAIQTANQEYLSLHDGQVTTKATVGNTEVFAFTLHRRLTDTEISVSIQTYDVNTGRDGARIRIDGVDTFTLTDEIQRGERLISLRDDGRWLTYDADTRTFSFSDNPAERAILRRAIKIAADERAIGTLLPGEVALYEHQNYWGKTWVFYRNFSDFGSVVYLNDRVSSIRVGAGTGATIYRNADYKQPEFKLDLFSGVSLIPNSSLPFDFPLYNNAERIFADASIRLSKESVYQDMPTLTESDVSDDTVSAIRVWTLTRSLPYHCTLSQDYRWQAGELSSYSAYRITLNIPTDVETVTIAATDHTTIQHEGKQYTINEDQSHVFPVQTVPSLLVTMPARGLRMPALKVRTDTMPDNTYFLIFPDQVAHRRLLDLPKDALSTATDRQGQPIVTNDQLSTQQVNMLQQAVQTTLQSVRYETTIGGDGRLLDTSVFNEEAWVLDFGKLEPTMPMSIARISATQMPDFRLSMTSRATAKQETTIIDDIGAWLSELGETIEDVIIEPVVEAVGNILMITIETADGVFKFIASTAEAVLEFVEEVLEFIGVQVKAFIEFLEYTFDWDTILKTQAVFNSTIEQGTEYASTFFNNAQDKAMAYLDKFESDILGSLDEQIAVLGGNIQLYESEDTPVTDAVNEAIDKVMWLVDKFNEFAEDITEALPRFDIDLMNIAERLKDIQKQLLTLAGNSVENITQIIDAFINMIEDLVKDPTNIAAVFPRLLGILRHIVAGGLGVVKGATDIIFNSIDLIIDALDAFLNLPLPIPFFADLFASITGGEPLTIRNMVTLSLAIPTAVLSQLTTGRVLLDGQLPQFVSNADKPTFSALSAPDQIKRDLSDLVSIISILESTWSSILDTIPPNTSHTAITILEFANLMNRATQNVLEWILVIFYGDRGQNFKFISSACLCLDFITFFIGYGKVMRRVPPPQTSAVDDQKTFLEIAMYRGAIGAIIATIDFALEFEDDPVAIMGHIANIISCLPDGVAMCRSQEILESTKGATFGVVVGAAITNMTVESVASGLALAK